MSQRNPMNERYQSEEHTGKTRKSAASAKPKAKAASSVIIKSGAKTEQEKKAERKAARRKAANEQRELDRKYYTPNTPRYKKLRRAWWALLIGAMCCVALGWFTRSMQPSFISISFVVISYVLIILAFWVEFSKVRKERRQYQEKMMLLEAENKRAEKLAARQAATEAHKPSHKKAAKAGNAKKKAQQPEPEPEAPSEQAPAKRGLFGTGFRLSNRQKMNEEKAARKASRKVSEIEAEADAEAVEAKAAK